MKQKLFTLMTLLVLCVTGTWADNVASDPATTTHKVGDNESQVFLDVANTTSNATITAGSVKCVTYGTYYLCASWKPSWVAGADDKTNSTDLSYTNYEADGFLNIANPSSGTNGEKAASSGYRNVKIRLNSDYERIFYVTGITGVAIISKDNNTSNRKAVITIQEVNSDGSLGAANSTASEGSTDAHIVTYSETTLGGLKYYKVTITGAEDGGDTYVSQIRFTQYIETRPAAPISWSDSYAVAKVGASNTFPTISNAESLAVSYSSSDAGVATIDAGTGVITLVANGKTVISAKYTSPGSESTYKTTTVSYILSVTDLVAQSNKFWNFAGYSTGDIASTTTADNLEIVATSSKKVAIATEARTIKGVDFTKKLTLNGTSDGDYRYIHFVVEPNKKIYVYHKAGGSGRNLKIDLNSKGGTNLLNEEASTSGDVYSVIYTGTNNAEIFVYSGNSGIDIYGIKVAPVYTVSYELNGGTGTTPTETKKGEGDKFDLHDGTTDITAPAGQVFDGWKDQDENTYDGGAEYTMPAKNVTLTAQWRTPAVKHTVTYDLNGGTGTVPTQEDVEEGANFEVASGTTGITAPENKRFSTWNDGTTDYAPGDSYPMGTSDVTLTAQWVDVYVVSKTTPEHGTIAVSPATAAAGDVVTLTATPEFRYQLDAWNVYKTGEPATTVTVTDNKFTMPAYAVTVEASFVADARKQILYLTSDGTVDASDKLFEALGEDYTITKAAYNASKTVTDFDLVVFHESIGGGNAKTGLVKAAIEGAVPVLNTKSYFYSDGRWGWGTPDAGKSVKGCTLNPAIRNVASHPIFSGVTIDGSNFLEITDEAAAKTMQPVTPVAGKEGYLLATSPLSSTGNATAIHELTPAQRGVASGKYLLISVSSAKLNELNANGKKLFQNAAAYLMGDDAWTPTITTNAGKWTSYTPGCNVTLQDGATAYFITDVTGSTITATPVTVLKAGEGYFVKGAAASTAYTATATAEDADATTGTLMVGQLASTTINTTTPDGNDKYVLGTATSGANNGKSGLFKVSGDVTVGAGKAYLNTGATGGAHSLSLNFDENGDVTGIQAVEVQKELLEGDFYNLKGQKVAQPTKGLYIVNGRKVVMK